MRLRFRELVVWRTGGKVLNAMVVGLTGRTRVIFVTDGLVERLPTEEVLAVFAHEAGHAKRHHLPLYLVLFFALALLFDSVAGVLFAAGVPEELMLAVYLGLLWFGLIGWLSRKFEREADVYGSDHAAVAIPDPGPVVLPGLTRALPYGASLMVRALDRIARLTGHTTSFRHGSIEDRIRYVAAYASDGEVRQAFRRQRRRLYAGIAALGVAAVGVAALQLPGEIRFADAQIRFDDAARIEREARAIRSERGPEAARDRYRDLLRTYVEAERALGDAGDGRTRALRQAVVHEQADVALRGLGDRVFARRALERVVAMGRVSTLSQRLLFHAHVDLGRIAAGAGDTAAAREHLDRARALRPDPAGAEGELLRARVALLQAVVEAREGVLTGRPEVERHARPRYPKDEWREHAEDAAEDLRLLPPA
jgi:hypothetical protein